MNIFAALDNSDSEEEQKVVPQKKAAAKDAAPAAKAAAPAAKKEKEAPKVPRVVPGMAPKETKPEKKAAPAPAAAPVAAKEEVAEGDASKDNQRGGRPRGKGREHKAGRGEQAEGERRPKREFDRKSGTGRGREVSRGGRGAFGFGNVDQDAQDAEKHPREVKDVLEPTEPQTDAAEEAAVVAEPERAAITLDQYMEKREQARARLHEILGPVDHPLRTVDKVAQFGNLEPKSDTDLDAYIPAAKGKKEQVKKEQRSKHQLLDVAFSFPTPQPEYRERPERSERPERRERPERDNRGGRGGRGEGRRHESKKTETPALSAQDFPSL